MPIGWILFGVIALASWGISAALKSKFAKYSKVPLTNGMTGKDIAQKMLHDNGIYDVEVVSTEGMLTDNYNPTNKTVNLSEGVYHSNSVAAAAVAAHECGHAVQHAKAYVPLTLRSALVPMVSFSSKWVMWVILAGIFTINTFPQLLWIGIGLFAITTVFSFVTLPVEIDASRRALSWLNTTQIVEGNSAKQAKDALKWAAYTYVVAALGSLATLVYYILVASNRR